MKTTFAFFAAYKIQDALWAAVSRLHIEFYDWNRIANGRPDPKVSILCDTKVKIS